MKKLSICIPNYNRLEKLQYLVNDCILQIEQYGLQDKVEICVSDDASSEDPTTYIMKVKEQYDDVKIQYHRYENNVGMDLNFLKSVDIATGQYAIIIGNDDWFPEGMIYKAYQELEHNEEMDFFVYSFVNEGETMYPYQVRQAKIFDTTTDDGWNEYVNNIEYNFGMFGFLSNVIFKRDNWNRYKEQYINKVGTIFIQMYINISVLKYDGGRLKYCNENLVNCGGLLDFDVFDRAYRIYKGLKGVIDFFFDNEKQKSRLYEKVLTGTAQHIFNMKEATPAVRREIIDSGLKCFEVLQKILVIGDELNNYKEDKIVIWGCGEYGEKLYKHMITRGFNVVAFAGNDAEKWRGKDKLGLKVLDLQQIKEDESHVVFIASMYYEEIYKQLCENGIRDVHMIHFKDL